MRPLSLYVKTIVFLSSLLLAVGAFAGPVVSLSPTSVDFGSQAVGTTSFPVTITLTNTGDATLNISDITGGGDFSKFTSCGATLAAGKSCTISPFFSPSTAGTITGRITVKDDAPGSPHRVPLKGVGTAPGIALAPTAQDFGSVAVGATSGSQVITITNQTNQKTITINSIQTNSAEFPQTNNCGPTLAAGASCSVNITFKPSTGGTRAALLSVSDSDASSPQETGLTGTGTSGTVSLSPSSLTFPQRKVGSESQPKNITVTNTGSTTLSIINVTASGDYSQTNTCGTSLGAGSSCKVSVTFKPMAGGARNGFITIFDTDASNLQNAALSGTGKASTSPVTVSPNRTSLTYTQSQQYQAFLNGSPTTDVTWYVDGVAGGNKTVGKISGSGLYTPPAQVGSHQVKAINNADSSQFGTARLQVTDFAGMYTYHNDSARTGQNTNERVLDTGDVNSAQFGKLFSYPVDGYVYTQPLYVANVTMPGKGSRNVIYVTTEHDSVYAFDADGKDAAPLWKSSFIDPKNGIKPVPEKDLEINGCSSIGPEVGISGTPVIDPVAGTIYVLARTKESGNPPVYHQQLHALDITTGAERSGSPIEIEASVSGTGEGSVNGTLSFNPLREHSRMGALLMNGVVYIAWSTICDHHPYHGWVIGYDAKSLAQVSVYNTSPDGTASGIWQANTGLAADSNGNIYFTTSNGTFTADHGGRDFGDSVVKIGTSGGLSYLDSFTPHNQAEFSKDDKDMSSSGVLILPDQPVGPPHLLLNSGKAGTIYLVNRDNMGQFKTTDDNQIVQSLVGLQSFYFGMPTFFQNQVFFWDSKDLLRSFRLYNGLLSTTPIVTSSPVTSHYPGPVPSVSSNGTTSGIIWASQNDGWKNGTPAILHAFDAANISRELYNSAQAGSRDQAGGAIRFQLPTVANGKVYLGTQTEIDVYGLLP